MALNSGALPTATAPDTAITQFNLVTSAINNGTPWGTADGGTGSSLGSTLSAFNTLSPLTTKGDMLTFDGLDHGRLAKGADNQGIIYNTAAGGGLKVTTMVLPGLQTIPIPVEAITPATTNGCSDLTLVELSSRNNFNVLDFDGSSTEYAHFNIPALPKSWNGGTIAFRPTYIVSSASTSGVVWGMDFVGLAKGDANDVAYGTSIVLITSANGTRYDEVIPVFSSAVTIGGSPVGANQTIEGRIFRNPGNGGDDLGPDARLKGITMTFTTNKANDNE
tara:strand:+ start:4432 stop:5262 length:831 start_codon:yes stop_codon:yes gene_type:complete